MSRSKNKFTSHNFSTGTCRFPILLSVLQTRLLICLGFCKNLSIVPAKMPRHFTTPWNSRNYKLKGLGLIQIPGKLLRSWCLPLRGDYVIGLPTTPLLALLALLTLESLNVDDDFLSQLKGAYSTFNFFSENFERRKRQLIEKSSDGLFRYHNRVVIPR